MARVKAQGHAKHKKIRELTKGYRNARSRRIKTGKEAILHAGQYAYIGRKLRKRDLRALWITRLNAAVREEGMSYSKFISALKTKKVTVDRKILSEIAATDPATFKEIVSSVK